MFRNNIICSKNTKQNKQVRTNIGLADTLIPSSFIYLIYMGDTGPCDSIQTIFGYHWLTSLYLGANPDRMTLSACLSLAARKIACTGCSHNMLKKKTDKMPTSLGKSLLMDSNILCSMRVAEHPSISILQKNIKNHILFSFA